MSQQEQVNLSNKPIMELKSLIYDASREISRLNQIIQIIEQEINNRSSVENTDVSQKKTSKTKEV